MRRVGLISFVLGLALISSAPKAAQTAPSAVSAWVAAPTAGATWAPAYVELKNPSMYDVFVVSATSDAAASVELRAASTGGAEPAVVPEFTVPAYSGVDAATSAPHLRLVGLTRALAAGDTVAIILRTDNGDTLKVAAVVRAP
ncbi:MAG TPA: copper chaperone PCu(A)C [Vicinamibacterales bacterium]|nr:copper chaperone PCu(A)C [Vicinamibacterales bacterium]